MLWAYDDELDFEEQPIYAQNCILDARESACMSTVLALTQHIAKMGPGGHEDALIELRDYFRERVEQCVFELGDGYPLTFYNSIDASWGIEREWNQPDLGDIVTLYLDVLIDGVEADAPPLECEDLELNNTWLFYSESQPQIYATEVVLDEGDASLVGPY